MHALIREISIKWMQMWWIWKISRIFHKTFKCNFSLLLANTFFPRSWQLTMAMVFLVLSYLLKVGTTFSESFLWTHCESSRTKIFHELLDVIAISRILPCGTETERKMPVRRTTRNYRKTSVLWFFSFLNRKIVF